MHPDIEHLLAQPFGSLPELIERQAAHRPGHTALVLEGQRLDYAALHAGMDRVARSLQRDGMQPGDVVAICAGTSVEYVLAYLGALRAGVAVAPLAPSATAEHLSAMLDNCGARLVLRD
uniref:AMP-binding protein n=3 Tax=Diaphorobacter TaxID=238749 RepID=UPI0028AF1EA2